MKEKIDDNDGGKNDESAFLTSVAIYCSVRSIIAISERMRIFVRIEKQFPKVHNLAKQFRLRFEIRERKRAR